MSEFLLAHEPIIRLAAFSTIIITMAAWEFLAPRRSQMIGRATRWPSNLGIVAFDAALVRIVFPTSAVALAFIAQSNGWGLLNLWLVPAWAAVPLAVIVLDFVIYLQHVLFHAVPALWKLHRMHHADLEFDVTTGARFHPIEIGLSMVIKLAIITALGAPAVAVLIFEVLLNATAMFNHSNVRLPERFDHMLRWLVVTPDMHRVHHSVVIRETNSNFGFNLPWWDRLFGTYRDQPAAGHERMTIGVEEFRDPAEQRLDRMLTQPFRAGKDHYALGQREAAEVATIIPTPSDHFAEAAMTVRPIVLLSALAIAAVAFWLSVNRDRLDPAALESAIRGLGWLAPVAHVALFAIGTVFFIPGALFGLAGGVLFGPVWGTVLNLTGATLGATAAFLVARYLAADWVRVKIGGQLERLVAGVEAEGWRFVALTRLVPLVPFNILNYALGLTRIPLIPYVIATFICMVPGTIAYAWLGHAGREAASGDIAAVRYGLLALALLAAIALLPRLARRWRRDDKLRWVEVAELAHRLVGEHRIAVIDVRGPNDFIGPLGHIGGARNLPLAEMHRRLPELAVLKNEPVVLVCRTQKMSSNAAGILDAAGFTDVGVLRGGMVQWNTEGHPVEGRSPELETKSVVP